MEHLIAAVAFVGSVTAFVVITVRVANDALDRLSTRRRIHRRLMAIGR